MIHTRSLCEDTGCSSHRLCCESSTMWSWATAHCWRGGAFWASCGIFACTWRITLKEAVMNLESNDLSFYSNHQHHCPLFFISRILVQPKQPWCRSTSSTTICFSQSCWPEHGTHHNTLVTFLVLINEDSGVFHSTQQTSCTTTRDNEWDMASCFLDLWSSLLSAPPHCCCIALLLSSEWWHNQQELQQNYYWTDIHELPPDWCCWVPQQLLVLAEWLGSNCRQSVEVLFLLFLLGFVEEGYGVLVAGVVVVVD